MNPVEGGIENKTLTRLCLACNRGYGEHVGVCPNDGTPLIRFKTGEDPWIGKLLAGRFQVKDQIGKGGIGVVYLAQDIKNDSPVAIKMLQLGLVFDDASIKRFSQEVTATSSMNHPHLVAWQDSGMTPIGQPFLVMEYLQGRSLRELIKVDGPLTAGRAVGIFAQVADGLEFAHQQGIVHRDLKPSNIILINHNGEADFAKVVDFGLAKLMPWANKSAQNLTRAGESFGSPIYMCPEQCLGKKLSPSSDVYSLAVALFEAVTGRPPFLGSNSVQTTSMHVHQPPPRFSDVRPNLELPEALQAVVMMALQKDPADRFQTMAQFRGALLDSLQNKNPAPVDNQLNASPVPNKESGNLMQAISAWLRQFAQR
jgi:serine/threonine protein kinase